MTEPADFPDSNGPQNAGFSGKRASVDQTDQPSDKPVVLKDVASTKHAQPDGEEPEMALEADLPSDGRDVIGEAMIRDLPQRTELSHFESPLDPFYSPTLKARMATNPNVPPPQPVEPLTTPPEPGEVQTTPMPMVLKAGGYLP